MRAIFVTVGREALSFTGEVLLLLLVVACLASLPGCDETVLDGSDAAICWPLEGGHPGEVVCLMDGCAFDDSGAMSCPGVCGSDWVVLAEPDGIPGGAR